MYKYKSERIFNMKKSTAMIRLLIPFPICFLLQFLMISPASAQGILSSDREAENRLSSYTSYTAPRKVYLHLNKSSYNAGDAIWFKAYLLDGVTHAPDTATTNLYVDLVSSRGLIMERLAQTILFATEDRTEGLTAFLEKRVPVFNGR